MRVIFQSQSVSPNFNILEVVNMKSGDTADMSVVAVIWTSGRTTNIKNNIDFHFSVLHISKNFPFSIRLVTSQLIHFQQTASTSRRYDDSFSPPKPSICCVWPSTSHKAAQMSSDSQSLAAYPRLPLAEGMHEGDVCGQPDLCVTWTNGEYQVCT